MPLYRDSASVSSVPQGLMLTSRGVRSVMSARLEPSLPWVIMRSTTIFFVVNT